MAVMLMLQRIFLHHPLTKSHIEDNEPGCAKVTRVNTEKNKRPAPAAEVRGPNDTVSHIEQKFPGNARLTHQNTAHNRVAFQTFTPSLRMKTIVKKRSARTVAFQDKGTVIEEGVEVAINFEPRKKRPVSRSFMMMDPNATPFLDRFKKNMSVSR